MIWSRKKLERVHSSLSTKFTWYNAWHKNKYHGKFHAGILAVFVLTAFAFSLYALNNNFFSKAAASYYVSPTGNDTNPGTQAAPFKTITWAAQKVAAGDTVFVAPGTYTERVNISRSGTSASLITFKGDGGQPKVSYGFNVTGSYINIANFEVSPGRQDGQVGYGALNAKTGSNINFENLYVHDLTANTQQAADIKEASRVTLNNIRFINVNTGAIQQIYLGGNTIKNSTVDYTKTTVPSVGKVVLPGSGAVIENNDFRFSYGNTIHIGGAVNGLTIKGNKFWKTGRPTTDDNHVQTIGFYDASSNINIEGNIFAGKPGTWSGPGGTWASQFTHIFFGDSTPTPGTHTNVSIKNNVFLNFDGAYWLKIHSDNGRVDGLKVYNNYIRTGDVATGVSLANAIYKNNIVSGLLGPVGTKDHNMYTSSVPTGVTGSFVGVPRFINGTITDSNRWGLDADWRLAAGSPGVDGGLHSSSDSNVPTKDLNCFTRVGNPDMGPYELNSVPSCGGTTPPATDPTDPPTDPVNPPTNTTGDYYVAPTGLDTNTGTLAAPLKTIQAAATRVKAGETIYLRSGTYIERPTFTTNGTTASRITIQAYGTEKPVISKGFNLNGSYYTLKNITVTPGDTTSAASNGQIAVSGSNNILDAISYSDPNWVAYNVAGLAIRGSSNTITNIDFKNSGVWIIGRGSTGVAGQAENNKISGGSIKYTRDKNVLVEADKTTVENLDISNPGQRNGGDSADAVAFNANNFTLRGNTIRNVFQTKALAEQHPDAIIWWNDGNDFLMEKNVIGSTATSTYSGTRIWDQGHLMWSSKRLGKTSHRVIIRNNIFIQTEGTYALNGSTGNIAGQQSGWKVLGNTFVTGKNPETGANGNMIRGASFAEITGWTIANNYFGGRGMDVTTVPSGCTLDNNVHSGYAPYSGSSHSFRNDTPNFVNPDLTTASEFGVKADFHLKSGSPLVGKGITSTYLLQDKDGKTRGNPPTIGAYEGTGTNTNPTPTDTTGPDVRYLRPTEGATVSGASVDNSASATDPSGIAKLEFYVDGVLKHTQVAPGSDGNYGYPWDSTGATNASHVLKVIATDKVGNTSSAQVTAIVSNNLPSLDTTPPIVQYKAPINGTTVTGWVNNSVAADDTSGIEKVEFYADGVSVHSQVSPGIDGNYGYGWDSTKVANGSHILKATAMDKAGNSNSVQVSVIVSNPVPDTTGPTVDYLRPTEGTTVTGWVDNSVKATDASGITKVDFYADNVVVSTQDTVGSDGNYGYGWDSTKSVNGYHLLRAVAFDKVGNTTTAEVSINVQNQAPVIDVTAPTVTYRTPLNGAVVSGWVNNSVAATDASGIAKVEFYADGVAVATNYETGADGYYGYGWESTRVTNGVHTLKAKAIDRFGNSKEVQVQVTVNNHTVGDTVAPVITSIIPANGATVSGIVMVSATATDNSGEVRQVEFTIGGVWSNDSDAPFTRTWDTTKVANGLYTITVKAADMAWNYGVAQVTVNVENTVTDVISPIVKITDPATNSTFTRSTVVLVEATDNVKVTRVDFFAGNTFLGSDNSAPYSKGWAPKGWPYGTYTITAKAYDAAGNVGVSSITVHYAKKWWQVW